MTPTDELVAALAEGLHQCGWNDMCAGNKGSACASCVRAAGSQAERLAPEARDKMLLGFAVAELEKAIPERTVFELFYLPGDDEYGPYTVKIWGAGLDKIGPSSGVTVTGSTPLTAVEAALKEVRDA